MVVDIAIIKIYWLSSVNIVFNCFHIIMTRANHPHFPYLKQEIVTLKL